MTARPIKPDDLEDPKAYEKVRSERLVAMGRYKEDRRLALADDVTLLFEDRRTIQHQIQEMTRLEGGDAAAVADIFRHYADIMPNGTDLIATLFVEVKEASEIKPRLRHYGGLAQSLRLEVGDVQVRPTLLGAAGDEAGATAVTYLRFPVPERARDRLDAAAIVVDHRHLQGRFPLPEKAAHVPG